MEGRALASISIFVVLRVLCTMVRHPKVLG